MQKEIIVTIRGVDERTYHRARTAALKARLPLGKWLCYVIKEKLSKKKGETNVIHDIRKG